MEDEGWEEGSVRETMIICNYSLQIHHSQRGRRPIRLLYGRNKQSKSNAVLSPLYVQY